MEIGVYKYWTEAVETAEKTRLALQTELKRSYSAAMAPTALGQASKDHLTAAHKVNFSKS